MEGRGGFWYWFLGWGIQSVIYGVCDFQIIGFHKGGGISGGNLMRKLISVFW